MFTAEGKIDDPRIQYYTSIPELDEYSQQAFFITIIQTVYVLWRRYANILVATLYKAVRLFVSKIFSSKHESRTVDYCYTPGLWLCAIILFSGYNLIKGCDGRDGLTGRDGLPGPTGAPGRNGHDGTSGQKGDKGERGEPGIVKAPGPVSGGATYTRWGRTSCPNITGTSLVYNGRAGKSWLDQRGGGGNYQCLPNNPEYGQYTPGVQGYSTIFGVEYQGPIQTALHDHNVPCAVCHVSTRAAVLMIPAWHHCPSQWTLEYTGYQEFIT